MANKPLIQHFVDEINVVIDKYRDSGITIGEIMGIFALAQIDLAIEMKGAQMDRDDDLPIGDPGLFDPDIDPNGIGG